MPLFPSVPTSIQEVTSDPTVAAQTPWVVYNSKIGSPIGLLLSLTYGGTKYKLSYQTIEGSIVRVGLT